MTEYEQGANPPDDRSVPLATGVAESVARFNDPEYVSDLRLGRKPVYPSFYDAVHRAWNEAFDTCSGDADGRAYDPRLHRCFAFAGALRVELHAAGIRLSNDGNGATDSPAAERMSGGFEPQAFVVGKGQERQLRQAIADSEQVVGYIDGDVGQQSYPPPGGVWAFIRSLFGFRTF